MQSELEKSRKAALCLAEAAKQTLEADCAGGEATTGDALTREALSRHDYLMTTSSPPPRNTVAKGHPGCVPPKASPPGIPSLATEERRAALEEEVARLRLRVDELEQHSSGAATG